MMPPKKLVGTAITLNNAWEPFNFEKFALTLSPQNIEVYPPPLFIMSPRIRVYKAKDIVKCKGYLKSCSPAEMEALTEMSVMIELIPTNPNPE